MEHMQRYPLTIVFNTRETIDTIDSIARKHNASRTETLNTLLALYDEDTFNKELPNVLTKMAEKKKALLEQTQANRKETRKLAALLNDNPELLAKFKRELANEE
jgi:DNA-binding transcriptional regulator YbjK